MIGFAYSGALPIWFVAIISPILLLIYLFALYFAMNNSFKIDKNIIFIIGVALINLLLSIAGILQIFMCYTSLGWTFRSVMQ